MTRLESSARDYAIALLAPSDLCAFDTLEMVERLDGIDWAPINRAIAHVIASDDPDTAARLVRARVALYLRTLRRVEAAERDEWWARFPATHSFGVGLRCCFGPHPNTWDAIGDMLHADAWRPLWTSAPPHEDGVTARTRRGR